MGEERGRGRGANKACHLRTRRTTIFDNGPVYRKPIGNLKTNQRLGSFKDGSGFSRLSAKFGPKTFVERQGSSCSAGCTKNQSGRPILKPYRGATKCRPQCLSVPKIYTAAKEYKTETIQGTTSNLVVLQTRPFNVMVALELLCSCTPSRQCIPPTGLRYPGPL